MRPLFFSTAVLGANAAVAAANTSYCLISTSWNATGDSTGTGEYTGLLLETSSLLTVVAAVYFPPAGPPTSRSATTTHVRLFKCVLVAGIL
jgi:hypothetical protein